MQEEFDNITERMKTEDVDQSFFPTFNRRVQFVDSITKKSKSLKRSMEAVSVEYLTQRATSRIVLPSECNNCKGYILGSAIQVTKKTAID